MSYTDEPQRIAAATRAMCRELYGDGFDLHDAGAQDPDFRAGLERAAEAAIDAALDAPGEMPGMRPMTRGESDLMTQVLDLRRKLGAIRSVADAAASFTPGNHGDRWVGPDEAHGRNIVGEEILAILDPADGGDDT